MTDRHTFDNSPRDYALELVEQGHSAKHLLLCALKYMSHDDVRGMLDANELSPRFDPWECDECGRVYEDGRHECDSDDCPSNSAPGFVAFAHCHLATREELNALPWVGGGRIGTIRGFTLDRVREIFGEPQETDIDGKVQCEWTFITPRGPVTVYDYWWNAPDELSIGQRGDRRAAYWIARVFRDIGARASSRREVI